MEENKFEPPKFSERVEMLERGIPAIMQKISNLERLFNIIIEKELISKEELKAAGFTIKEEPKGEETSPEGVHT